MIRIPLLAPDARLARQIVLYDERQQFETVRFLTLQNALVKTRPDEILLIQWTVEEILETLRRGDNIERPFIVYCPELNERTAKEYEELYLALLQFGATAVFSQARQLPKILAIIERNDTQKTSQESAYNRP